MALDSRVTAQIGIEVANSLQALEKINQYGSKIGEVFQNILNMSTKLELGNKKQANALRAEIQTFQRLIGEASTLQNVVDSVAKRAQKGLFNSTLDIQRLGKLSLEASKLKNGLDAASKSSETLAQRLALVKKEAAAVTEAGGTVRRSTIQRAESFEARLRDIKALENSIRRIDQNATAGGGFGKQSQQVRNQLAAAELALMQKVSDKRTSNFDKEIGQVRRLRDELNQTMKVEAQAGALAQKEAEKRAREFERLAERRRALREKLRREEDADARRELALMKRQQAEAARAYATAARQFDRDMRTEDRRQVRRENLLAPQGMRDLAQQIGARATLQRMVDQQRAAEASLAAATGKQVDSAARALEVANMRVRAAERLVRAEEQAARATTQSRSALLNRVNMNEAQLRASVERGASRFSFTPQQARDADMVRTGQQIDRNIQRLMVLQQLMSRALAPGSGRAPEALERLQRSWERISQRTSEAIALRRQYDQLPEQRGARIRSMITETMFGDGGIGLGTRMAGAIGIGMGISAVFSGLTSSLRTVAQMEDELAKLQAISGSTDGEMSKLSRSIFEVGNSSRYSTLEIAQGATTIAQAGFAAAETADVLKNSLNLAAASGSSPAEAIDLMTSSLGAFNLQASESAIVADTIAAALNETKLSVEQFRLAVQYAGATAKENNVSIQELAAISGSLANAGIRSGSTIGTGIRQLLVDMKTPTDDFKKELESLGLTLADVDVKALGMAQVVRNLTEAGFSAEQAYNSFEVRAASSFLAFRNQIDNYDDLAISLQQSGAAARAAAEASDSLSAKWTTLKNNLLDLVTVLGTPFLNILKTVVDLFGGVVGAVNTLVGGFGELLGVSGSLSQVLSGTLIPALAALAIPGVGLFGAAIAGAVGLASSLLQLDTTTNQYTQAANEASAALDQQAQTVSSLAEAQDTLIDRERLLTENKAALEAETMTLIDRFEGLAEKIDFTKLSYEGLLTAMQQVTEETLRLQQAEADRTALTRGQEADQFFSDARNSQRRIRSSASKIGGVLGTRAEQAFADDPTLQGILQRIYSGDPTSRSTIVAISEFESALAKRNKRLQESGQTLGTAGAGGVFRNLGRETEVVKAIRELKDQLTQGQSAQAAVTVANRTSQRVDAFFNTGGPGATQTLTNIRRIANEGETANKDAQGSGTAKLQEALGLANSELERLQKSLGTFGKDSAEYRMVESQITDVRANISNINRALRPEESSGRGNTPPGGFRNAAQTGELLRQNFGITPGSGLRDRKKQEELYQAYLKGGNLAAKPGTSAHEHNRAIDISIPKDGTTPAQMKAWLESQGYRGVKILHPGNSNYKSHWHVQWTGQASAGLQNVTQAEDRAAEQERRDLQQLMQAQARARLGTVNAEIATLTTNTRTGLVRPADALAQFEGLRQQRDAAAIAQFEAQNPVEGLSETALKVRELALNDLKEQNRAQGEALLAQIWRGISDAAFGAYDSAIKVIEQQSAQQRNAAELGFEGVASVGRTRDNIFNRNRNDAGTRFIQERSEFGAGLTRDQQIVDSLGSEITKRNAEIEKLKTEILSLTEGTELYNEAQGKLAEALQAVNNLERERLGLMQSISERTQVVADLPLEERLRGAAQAWRESSGAMRDFQTQMVDNVGPMLDQLTGGFDEFFTSLTNGTKSFKQALGDMLRSFISFVQQMVIRALALMAVQAIMNAIAPGSGAAVGGGASKTGGLAKAFLGGAGRFEGGLTAPVPGLMRGGRVQAPSPLRDSKLYNLADGEYVVRNKSVRDLGLPFMDAINKHGKAGLGKVAGSAFTNIQAPKQETNVWVVAEPQEAGMGPNDVLVTIHRDIMQGGPTKKLIRQVAQGM